MPPPDICPIDETVIVLPGREEMERRLLALCAEPLVVESVYPILLNNAGEEKFPIGVVQLVVNAMHPTNNGLDSTQAHAIHAVVPCQRLIEVLIDDETARAEAMAFLATARSRCQ